MSAPLMIALSGYNFISVFGCALTAKDTDSSIQSKKIYCFIAPLCVSIK
jgi:hypothetical protein